MSAISVPRVLVSTALLLAGVTTLSAAEYRDEFHQTYPLSANGRVALSNVNGAVRIGAWDRNEVKVDAIKTAETREALNEASIVVQPSGDAIEIKTKYPDEGDRRDRDRLASVEYTVTVPRRARLESISVVNGALTIENVAGGVKASAVNGRVTAQHLQGPTEISTVNGELEAGFDRVEDRVKLSSVNGAVNVAMPPSVSARFKATTVHGSIHSDFPVSTESGLVGHRMEGTVGSGANEVSLNTVNGSIRVTSR